MPNMNKWPLTFIFVDGVQQHFGGSWSMVSPEQSLQRLLDRLSGGCDAGYWAPDAAGGLLQILERVKQDTNTGQSPLPYAMSGNAIIVAPCKKPTELYELFCPLYSQFVAEKRTVVLILMSEKTIFSSFNWWLVSLGVAKGFIQHLEPGIYHLMSGCCEPISEENAFTWRGPTDYDPAARYAASLGEEDE